MPPFTPALLCATALLTLSLASCAAAPGNAEDDKRTFAGKPREERPQRRDTAPTPAPAAEAATKPRITGGPSRPRAVHCSVPP